VMAYLIAQCVESGLVVIIDDFPEDYAVVSIHPPPVTHS
jgi:hypothetical protein